MASSLYRMECDLAGILQAVATNSPYRAGAPPIETVQLGAKSGSINPLEALFLADRLATAMLTNTSVTALDLSGRVLQASAAEGIETILKKHATLTSLNLDGNAIGVTGAKAIARGLAENESLIELHLNDPTLGVEGLEALQEALESNPTLRVLTLPSTQEFTKPLKDPDPKTDKMPAPHADIERIEASLIDIRQEIVEREIFYEMGAISNEEKWCRELVKPIYQSLMHHIRANVEFHVWKQFECPKGDLEFGKKHVFTSWSIFLASLKAAKVNMMDAIEKRYKNPHNLSPGEVDEIRAWAEATFR
ncbi:MAG: hypothetical protein V4492_09080 [Chlamydiota bacterium]